MSSWSVWPPTPSSCCTAAAAMSFHCRLSSMCAGCVMQEWLCWSAVCGVPQWRRMRAEPQSAAAAAGRPSSRAHGAQRRKATLKQATAAARTKGDVDAITPLPLMPLRVRTPPKARSSSVRADRSLGSTAAEQPLLASALLQQHVRSIPIARHDLLQRHCQWSERQQQRLQQPDSIQERAWPQHTALRSNVQQSSD